MKQYTTPDQTAKLIELGFEKPKTIVDKYYDYDAEAFEEVNHYSIGELIEILSNDDVATTRFEYDGFNWYVDWDSLDHMRQTSGVELIDVLYDMCVQLKEAGVI